jgi:hypothetical protein
MTNCPMCGIRFTPILLYHRAYHRAYPRATSDGIFRHRTAFGPPFA